MVTPVQVPKLLPSSRKHPPGICSTSAAPGLPLLYSSFFSDPELNSPRAADEPAPCRPAHSDARWAMRKSIGEEGRCARGRERGGEMPRLRNAHGWLGTMGGSARGGPVFSHRAGTAKRVVDLDRLQRGYDEDLAVADGPLGAGPRHVHDRFQGTVEEIVVDDDFQRDLAEQCCRILVAAIEATLPSLAAEALGIANRHPRDLDLGQRLLDGLELCRLDDGDDQFQRPRSPCGGAFGRPARFGAGRRLCTANVYG